ncbi:MAG: hypothetical protein H7832_02125 [Magnetococcus sp. DMHC-6]
MKLPNHDLKQMGDAYLDSLDMDRLRAVSKKLLTDLKESRERLDQNPQNSSVPPGSRPAYLGMPVDKAAEADTDEGDSSSAKQKKTKLNDEENSAQSLDGAGIVDQPEKSNDPNKSKRKAGKQLGAPGYGRTQVIPPHRLEVHCATQCTACGEILPSEAPFFAKTGFYVIDIKEHNDQHWGVELECTLHHYGETECCGCGHQSLLMPSQGDGYESADGTITTRLSEWRLIGPRLASFIVFLTYRMRLSRARIQEFLQVWFGLRVAPGQSIPASVKPL